MFTTMARGLLISTFLISAVPAWADAMLPGVMGTTTMGSAMLDAKGMALYTFDKDAGGKSMCNGDCAVEWPPLMVEAGAMAAGDWTIVLRDDGSKMWAFKGQPLYTFVDDKAAGQVTGDAKDGFHLAGMAAAASVDANGMVAIATMGTTTLGKAWVDSNGMALYTYEKDAGGKSMCNGDCAVEWPPLMVAAGGKAAGDWTIVARDDGAKMWAFKGHPLYTFVDDKAAGQVTGDNKDGFHLAM